MLYYEKKLKKKGFDLIIGVDEAGRGPLAGPVVAAAVALSTYRFKNRIDDSKKLTARARNLAYPEIISKSRYGIGIIDEKLIDKVNILVATRMAMEQAVFTLLGSEKPKNKKCIHIIVDGRFGLDLGLSCTPVIGGDGKSKSIAAASILAKVTRDRIMDDYDFSLPEYRFKQHKGYGTRLHLEILKRIGPSPIHRKSFLKCLDTI